MAESARSKTPQSCGSFLPRLLSKYTDQYAIPSFLAPAALQICIIAFPLGVLVGVALPKVLSFFVSDLWQLVSTSSKQPSDYVNLPWYSLPQVWIFLLAWCVFHLLEFLITACYNPTRLYSDSFLLNNGIAYHIAHLFALFEFGITSAFFHPQWKQPSLLTLLGLALLVLGQTVRSLAMVHAHSNFSHIVAHKKRPDHELVTTGVYSWTRHPSYFGFFYWAIGTQLLLANPLGLVGFVLVLYRFFSGRIEREEKHLVEFFGDRYIEYKRRVPTYLPLIR